MTGYDQPPLETVNVSGFPQNANSRTSAGCQHGKSLRPKGNATSSPDIKGS